MGKKKGKKDKVAVIPGGLTAEEEKDRQLKAKKAFEYFKETKIEEKKFDTYRQEREQLNYFWIVEKKRLEDKKAELRCARRVLRCGGAFHGTRVHRTMPGVVYLTEMPRAGTRSGSCRTSRRSTPSRSRSTSNASNICFMNTRTRSRKKKRKGKRRCLKHKLLIGWTKLY